MLPPLKGRLLHTFATERTVDNDRLARDVVYHTIVGAQMMTGAIPWDGQYVHDYVRQHITYREDPGPHDQRLRMPWKTMEEGIADCKSTAILIAGLALKSGRETVLRFVDQTGKGWDHVYAVVDGIPNDPLMPYGEELPHLYYHDEPLSY